MTRATRKRIAAGLCLIILIPVMPIAVLRFSAEALADFLDWATQNRPWFTAFGKACERVERAFGVDADTEYAEWKARMKAKREATP